eukprot:UN25681
MTIFFRDPSPFRIVLASPLATLKSNSRSLFNFLGVASSSIATYLKINEKYFGVPNLEPSMGSYRLYSSSSRKAFARSTRAMSCWKNGILFNSDAVFRPSGSFTRHAYRICLKSDDIGRPADLIISGGSLFTMATNNFCNVSCDR